MKKTIVLIIVLSMAAVMLAACGKDAPEQETEAATEEVTAAAEEETAAAETEEEAEETEAPAIAFTDGTYTAEVTMEGGSGRASIQSPATIVVKDGAATAVIVWSSDKYDYMLVDGVHYDPVTTEGGSTFRIPVAAFDEPLTVVGDTIAMSEPHEIEYTFTFDSSTMTERADLDSELAADAAGKANATEETAEEEPAAASLEDGVYYAEFDTDSSMFHVNESMDGKGVLTVKGGEMTIHISLVSKKILNLFPGLAEDAEKEGAALLEPTVDSVTYSDGYTEEVFGFDVPVPVLDEEFDLALIGEKGKWYDHKVSVSNPVPLEETTEE